MNNVPSKSLEKVMEYVQSDNPSEALRILSVYQPSSQDLASYHLAYAKAYDLSGKQYNSITHLRLAYLYSKDNEMKEQALIERAETYAKIGFHSEAGLVFRICLKNFPNSRHSERVFLGLAESSYRLGLFSEARDAYEKAGNSSRALYGKANALHSMGKIEDAHKIYLAMLEKDRGYVQSSQETLYNIGENLRLMGDASGARIYFNSITALPFKYRSFRSLGLMELEEEHLDVAKKFFYSALQSSDKNLRRQVLLNLADTYIKLGKQEEAKSRLLEIRKQYPYGKDYDEALLMLSQIYQKEGDLKGASSLIKELVFRHPPNQKALDEFEGLILEAADKGEEDFLKLWRAAGRQLLQPSRSQSILKIAKGLRHSGKSYPETLTWLSQHGADDVKSESTLLLADFYADLGDSVRAVKYIQINGLKGKNDKMLRTSAKIYRANAEYQKAVRTILDVKELNQDDLVFLTDLLESVRNDHKVMGLIKSAVNSSDVPPSVYVKLADVLYEMGERVDALHYYTTAVSLGQKAQGTKNQDLEWALYRTSLLSADTDARNTIESIRRNNDTDTYSRLPDLLLKEMNVSERMKGIF